MSSRHSWRGGTFSEGQQIMRLLGLLAFMTLLTAPATAAEIGQAYIMQIGNGNYVTLEQLGGIMSMGIVQEGSGNHAESQQNGRRNNASVAQYGNRNTALLVQMGKYHAAAIVQGGNNLNAASIQIGAGSSPVSIHQTGNGAPAVVVTTQ